MAFKIQQIDPPTYRKNTRNATLRIMAIFIVLGLASSFSFPTLFGENPHNLLTLQIMGALIGLGVTFFIVAKWLRHKPWMYEAMYGWQLKRSLMHITNAMKKLEELVAQDNPQALKFMRFYHLGISQMYEFEQNTTGLIDLKVEKEELENKLKELEIDLNQDEFDVTALQELIAEKKD